MGTESFLPLGSRIITSGKPLPAPLAKISKCVGRLMMTPSASRPGPDAVKG